MGQLSRACRRTVWPKMKNRKIKRLCTKVPGCPAFKCSEDGCLRKSVKVHQIARTGNEHHRFYATKVWKAIRDIQLSAYPLCERCLGLGVVTPAVAVDHVTPHKGDWSLFIAQDNRQSLCVSCHSYKTAMENRGVIEDYRDSRDKQTKCN